MQIKMTEFSFLKRNTFLKVSACERFTKAPQHLEFNLLWFDTGNLLPENMYIIKRRLFGEPDKIAVNQ